MIQPEQIAIIFPFYMICVLLTLFATDNFVRAILFPIVWLRFILLEAIPYFFKELYKIIRYG
jgi:hypothetical protein